MSYQERRALVSFFSALLIPALYAAAVLPSYPAGSDYSPEAFHFWGRFILTLIGVSIVARIAIFIAFSILNTIATREAEPEISDERDRMIELKAGRIALYIFCVGFLLAMFLLVLSQPPSVMFLALLGAGLASDAASELAQFFYYRRGF